MPPVWRGRRRWLLASLVVLGVLQAVFAIAMALSVGGVLSARQPEWDLVLVLVLSVLGIGLARWMERIVAEQVGQDYVYEQRRRLIASAILGERGNKSLGVIVTRASNDLTAVRNWIAQGIVPLATGLPLVLVVLAALWVIDWRLGAAVTVPLALTAAAIPRLSGAAFERARSLRRQRGRMSSHIADTVRAGPSIRISGAVSRELNAVDRNSSRVVESAVERARITGFIRALTVTAASLCTVVVVLLSMLGVIDAAGVASVMTLLGIMSTPMSDLGRVVEYRQNYKAARRILAPVLQEAIQLRRAEQRRERAWKQGAVEAVDDHEGLSVRGLTVHGTPLPDIDAVPGDRIRMVSEHSARPHQAIQQLLLAGDSLNPQDEDGAYVLIDGKDYVRAPRKERRELVGYASLDIPLEQGSIRRIVTYRRPGGDDDEVLRELERVGMGKRVGRLHRGLGTKLENNAAGWSPSDVTRLKLARALHGQPPLLVLENISVGLDDEGRDIVRELLDSYPGVILFATARPEAMLSDYRIWEIDGETDEQREATRQAMLQDLHRGHVHSDAAAHAADADE